MAEENTNPIDPLQEQQPAPLEPEVQPMQEQLPLQGPGSTALQIETEQATEDQERTQNAFEEKRKQLELQRASESRTGVAPTSPITDEQVLDALDQEAAEVEEAQAAEELDLEKQIAQRENLLARAEARGVTLPRNEELDSIIEQRKVEGTELPEDLKENLSSSPTQDQVMLEQNAEAQRLAIEEGQNNAAIQKEAQDAQRLERAQRNLQEQDKVEQETPQESFWDRQSTGSKIGMVIASAIMGAAGMGGQAISLINKMVDDDLARQNLDFKKQQAKKSEAYNRVLNNLKIEGMKTDNELKKARIAETAAKIQQEKAKVDERRLVLEQSATSGGVNPALLEKEDRERVVRLPNGNAALADNKAAADKLRNFKNEVEPAIEAARRVIALSKSGSRFSLEDRARISTEMQALVGNLRLPFLGPGAMTDNEYERLRSTLGDPNKFFALPSIERRKLDTVLQKLTTDLKTNYKNAGIPVPDMRSKREKLVETFKKFNPKSSDAALQRSIDRLIEKGKLDQEYN